MRAVTLPELTLAFTITLAACGGSDSFSPSVETVSGSYIASTLSVTSSSGTTDLLAAGATVSVSLAANGTTTGRLFVPGGAEDGSDLDADLSGTWNVTGSTVTFAQAADTFIRDAEFTATENRLSGDGTFSDVTVRLVLTKTG